MSIEDKFLRYVSFDTQAMENSDTVPSTLKQLELARQLKKELEELGFDSVKLDENGVVYAILEANTNQPADAIGFIAHMDTALELPGKDVKPRIIKNYDGGLIRLNEEYSMSPEQFPVLNRVIGDDLIVTDGTTLLGADDKAGIAIIMQAMEELIEQGTPHGKLAVAFTPDEEIGCGVDHFKLEEFPVDYAYTVDGGDPDGVTYETFNAAQAIVDVKGRSIHPGEAKDKMVNACLAAMEFNALLPEDEIPAKTSGYEGFYHLVDMSGSVDHARLVYILREHDQKKFAHQKEVMKHAARVINEKYPGAVKLSIRDQYYNMYLFLKDDMKSVERAKKALDKLGRQAVSKPIRGGTDGAMLSAKGLPTPNLGTGSSNHHGRYEFASIQKMNDVKDLVKQIALIEE